MENELIIYGTTWCGDCQRTRGILDREKIAYRFINIDEDPAGAAYVIKVNKGNRSVPTMVFPNGCLLVEPGYRELMGQIEEMRSQQAAV